MACSYSRRSAVHSRSFLANVLRNEGENGYKMGAPLCVKIEAILGERAEALVSCSSLPHGHVSVAM